MQTVILSVLSLVVTAAAGAQVSAHVGQAGGSSSFQAQGAALSEAVGPDGSRQGECAFADSQGRQIKVRYSQSSNGPAEYTTLQGGNHNPEQAYKQCVEEYNRNLQAQPPFVFPDFQAFNPFAGGMHQAFGGFFGGPEVLVRQGGAAGPPFTANHQQVQHSLQQLQQQNIDLHNQLMQQLAG